jgi:hypothetical protein
MKFLELKVGQLFSLSGFDEIYIKINPKSCILVYSSRMSDYRELLVQETDGSFNPMVDVVIANFVRKK